MNIKKLFLTLIALFCLTQLMFAEKKADIVVSDTLVDMGVFKSGDNVKTYEVQFKNKGKKELQITKVLSDCPCTTSQFEKDKLYARKESGIVKVTINLKGFLQGHYEKKIAIYSNSKKNNPIYVTFMCVVNYDR